jgi:hypothetical protein
MPTAKKPRAGISKATTPTQAATTGSAPAPTQPEIDMRHLSKIMAQAAGAYEELAKASMQMAAYFEKEQQMREEERERRKVLEQQIGQFFLGRERRL